VACFECEKKNAGADDSDTPPWPRFTKPLSTKTSVFQAARGSDGLRMTPTSEIQALEQADVPGHLEDRTVLCLLWCEDELGDALT
jgi:hypothetical protein